MNYNIFEFSKYDLSLSAQHAEFFLKSKAKVVNLELLPAFDEDFLKNAKGAFVDLEISEDILSGLSTLPPLVRSLECFDVFLKDGGRWYPRLTMFDALRELIIENGKGLDIKSGAYVIGSNIEARISAAVLSDIGFSDIYLVSPFSEKLFKTCLFLKKKYIGINFHEVSATTMTMQTVQSGIVVNCMDLSLDLALQGDLSYFNFIKRNGLVIDYHNISEHSDFLEEAEKAELRTLDAKQLLAKRDWMILSRMGLVSDHYEQDFKNSWKDFIKSLPLSSYKKRHS